MKWGKPCPKDFGGYQIRFALFPRKTIDGWIWLEKYEHYRFGEGAVACKGEWHASWKYRRYTIDSLLNP